MSFKVEADIVSLFEGLVISLQPFASSQEVDLKFERADSKLCYYYNPKDILPDVTTLLCRIISFTPQSYEVSVKLDASDNQENALELSITNTGANLSKVGEILKVFNGHLTVENLKNKGTLFIVQIQTQKYPDKAKSVNIGHFLPKQYPAYYKAINKRLTTHFSNLSNLEDSAMQKGNKEGVFLKKVNTVINSNMESEDFNVSALASAMALSRTQLFRKLKALTKMSPSQYVLFFRLQTAKQLLQSNKEDLNVSDVCYRTGFSSKSHFTRSFNKQFGFNPSACN
ncbi:MAG: AraC family transcriptional regulator [Eudoraea sp.]|uniref:helix-turn-helix domain-containing protein n=2 Tax=Eudoraea sp. TaxID=1979955 RepID=UPI003C71E443